jgi:cytochrome c553
MTMTVPFVSRFSRGWRPLMLGLLLAAGLMARADEGLQDRLAACQACHGAAGVSVSPDIPNLAGQKSAYLLKQLQAFHQGERKNELMQAIAAQLTEADMHALAAFWSSQPGTPAAAPPAPPAAAKATLSRMAFPPDFPKGFVEYARDNDTDAKRVQVSYANPQALQAARARRPLPDGAIVMRALYAAQLDDQGHPQLDAQGRWRTGKLLSYNGMEAGAGWGEDIPPLLRNGNWHYGLFTADGTPRLGNNQPRCLACHKPQAADSYVFTLNKMR